MSHTIYTGTVITYPASVQSYQHLLQVDVKLAELSACDARQREKDLLRPF